MNLPLISIITPSFNRAAMIADAVESVLAQEYPNFEHIIVDGASTDRTLEVLKKYPHLRIVSEPDRGMYDAINKGIALAHGEVVAWLNTDDLYPPGAFLAVADSFNAHPEALAISGAAETFVVSEEGQRVVRTEGAVDDVDTWRRIVEAPVPNGWFFRKSLFEKVGNFNADFRLVADREFLIRVALAGIRPVPVARTLYRYRLHEGSATFHAEDSRHPVYGPRRMDVNREDLRMVGSFLVRSDLPLLVRRVMVRAHSEYAYRLAATALYHRRWDLVREGVRAGFRFNPFFPLIFIRFALRRIFRGRP
jgi:glycosyltransferase involved in cell wall biosynthesis